MYSGGGGIHGSNVSVFSSLVSGNSAGGKYGSGGGISGKEVSVSSSIIAGNSTDRNGGGISGGNVTVTSSTIADNTGATGGGISGEQVTVNSSTITGNLASDKQGLASGGGISGEHVTVNFSTISGNSAVDSKAINTSRSLGGGGISGVNVTVNSGTIVDNSATLGGGIIISDPSAGHVTILNSIVARNNGTAPDLGSVGPSSPTLTIQHSLIGDNRGSNLSEAREDSPDANGNLIGGPMAGMIDPLLGPLADNGGPTQTHALLPGSAAIDAGDTFAVAGINGLPFHDQRGEPYANVVDGDNDGVARIDMGAYERQSLTFNILSVPSQTVVPVNEVTIQFTTAVSGFDLGDLKLSRNGGEDDSSLTSNATLRTTDNQTFVLSGMANATSLAGYYTLTLPVLGSGIEATNGEGRMEAGNGISWAMGRSTLGLTVNTLLDEADGRIDDGDVSLRDAIAAAASGETINFDASLDGGTMRLTLGELLITRSLNIDAIGLPTGLVIDAAGNDPTPLEDDGQGSRIFGIDDGNPVADSPVMIRGLVLRGGDAPTEGGAIRSRETLLIDSVSVTGNAADSAGGGIWAAGDVTVRSSTISGNSTAGRYGAGGGINASNVVVQASTISGNAARGPSAYGGGISGLTVTVAASTISGNAAREGLTAGGGIAAFELIVTSSTISTNEADFGGGIWANDVTVNSSTIAGNSAGGIRVFEPANVVISNSIVARNNGTAPDLGSLGHSSPTLTIQHSLIGDHGDSDLGEAPVGSPDANGNLIGGPVGGTIDPLLGPLADNGGPTQTHALLPGSPAIDAGDPLAGSEGVSFHDQRGEPYVMVVDGNNDGVARIDMGAHEQQNLLVNFESVLSPTSAAVDAVTVQFTSAVTGLDLSDLMLTWSGSDNKNENLLTGSETLSSTDGQTFVLSGMANATTTAGYYTLKFTPFRSGIIGSDGSALNSGAGVSWAMGRSALGLTVNTLVDEADGRIDDGDISLRDAIGAAAPGETISFDDSLDGDTIQLTRGELLITRPLTVDATALATGLVIDAAPNDPTPTEDDGRGSRIFRIDDGDIIGDSPVTLRGLTLTGGDVLTDGGAIYSRESLKIESVSISRNSADSDGGGIWSAVDVTVSSSDISRNSARLGGGIYADGNVAVDSSEIAGNSAIERGGIYGRNVTVDSSTIADNSGGGIHGGTVTVDASTIARNSYIHGAGIRGVDVTVRSSTISGNSGTHSGGVDALRKLTLSDSTVSGNSRGVRGMEVTIVNSIVAGNDGQDLTLVATADASPSLTVQHSLIGEYGGTSLLETPAGSPDANGNLVGGPVGGVIDPLLGALADNGGPTWTHALLPGSPAIDAGDPTAVGGSDDVPPFDQRGAPFCASWAGASTLGPSRRKSCR